MQLYAIIFLNRESGRNNLSTKVFETKRERAEFFDYIADKKRREYPEWTISEIGVDFTITSPDNAECFSMQKETVVLDSNVKVRMAFGTELCRQLENYDEDNNGALHLKSIAAIKAAIPDIGNIVQRKFSTTAEVNAYYTGMADIDGWGMSLTDEDFPQLPDEVWNEFGNRDW